jgi:HD-like signal output (HDOD) protein
MSEPPRQPSGLSEQELGQRLADTLHGIDIPPCPAILTRIQNEMQRDEPDLRALAEVIRADVALAAGLIALCNSPFFGLRQPVRSPEGALLMLGLTKASRAIAGLVLKEAFPPSPAMERFWDASGTIARLSGWLSQCAPLAGRARPDDAYTFGLFRDSGIPVLWQKFPQYPDVLRRANAEAVLGFTQVEDQSLPTNHTVVGSMLAQSWWLPPEVCQAIRHHHAFHLIGAAPAAPPAAAFDSSARALVALAQLAEHLLQQHTGLSLTREWDKARLDVMTELQLEETALRQLYAESGPVVAIKA